MVLQCNHYVLVGGNPRGLYGVSIPGHNVMSLWLCLTKLPLWPLYRFISFISKCLSISSSNSIVNLISHLAITNPLSNAGKNYRSVIDAGCELNNSLSIIKWNN